jgi:hypothetical protein
MKTSALDGGEWSASRTAPFTRACLDALSRKNLAPAGNRTPAVQPVARRYTDRSPIYLFIKFVNAVVTRIATLNIQ